MVLKMTDDRSEQKFRRKMERGSITKTTGRKTKVVIRKLPPSISRSLLFSRFDTLFSRRYTWSSFRPGNEKRKKQSRAYIQFSSPEDVVDFAHFFNGHLFVTDKGVHFRAVVEYAPFQRLPKQAIRKDTREGTIFTDPEYLEFLKLIAKPVEFLLPRVEIQPEIKEAEQPGVVVTPLMEFVRQKRALGCATQGSKSAVQIKKPDGLSLASTSSSCKKRATNKEKLSMKKGTNNNSTQNGESATGNGKKLLHEESGVKGSSKQFTVSLEPGKTAPLKTRTIVANSHAPKDVIKELLVQSIVSKSSPGPKRNSIDETRERLIRGNENEACQNNSSVHGKKEAVDRNLECGIRPPWSKNANAMSRDYLQSTEFCPQKGAVKNSSSGKTRIRFCKNRKEEDQGTNEDRLDPTVLTDHALLDRQHVKNDNSTSVVSESRNSNFDHAKDPIEDMKTDAPHIFIAGKAQAQIVARSNSTTASSDRHGGPHAAGHLAKDIGSRIGVVRKHSSRGNISNNVQVKKQVWVLKPSSVS